MKLLLVCNGGISTSILMRKLKTYAADHGIEDFDVDAHGFAGFGDIIDDYDCILAGPQIGYRLDDIKASGKPADVISTADYGSANCEGIFAQINRMMAGNVAAVVEKEIPGIEEATPAVASAEPEQPEVDDSTFFGKLFNSGLMKGLQAVGTKMQASKAIQAISGGMQSTMALVMTGAVFTILASILNVVGIISDQSTLYQQLMIPYNMTMGLLSVAIAFAVGYIYTKNLGMKGELANGIVSLVLFLMVAAPFKSVELVDGSIMTAMDTSMLGGTGIFTALIVPLIAVKIIKFCQDRGFAIKMPDVVPPFLGESFSALIPLFINVVLFRALAFASESLTGASLPALIMGLISMPLSVFTSGPGVILLGIIGQILWAFGMHGNGIVYIALMAPIMQASALNSELWAQGQAPIFNTVFLFGYFCNCGGAGNLLPLAVAGLKAKSERVKSVCKLGVVPAAFNISEPMIFGLPLMYNATLFIPFVLNGAISALLIWAGFATGFFVPGHIMIMSVLPVGVAEFLSSFEIRNVLQPVISFIVGYLVYTPFLKMYDRQCLAEEQAKAAVKDA